MRAIPLLLLSILLCACAAPQPRKANPDPLTMHDLFPSQDLPASNAPVPAVRLEQPAKPAPQAAVPPDTPPPMNDTPPAADAATASLSCNHYNCATILSITKHRGLEDFTPGADNGPGTYFATDIPEGNAVGQPQDMGAVFEKEAKLWEITVRMQDGTVQTMQQDYLPGVQVGDSVLIEGNTIQPWN